MGNNLLVGLMVNNMFHKEVSLLYSFGIFLGSDLENRLLLLLLLYH
jgi:hypothetical protein